MDNFLSIVWGDDEHLNALQMSVRAVLMFMFAIILIRLGGMRTFGKKSSFDNVIVIMLGAVLARGVVGASPFFSTVTAGLVMIMIHRLMAWISLRNKKVSALLKGEPVMLYKQGNIIWKNMKKTTISEDDLMESLRLETQKTSLEEVETAFLETNGRISFILKKE
jgi:uncharacterized membrane protein YcaP (DUF421 family)